MRSSLKNTSFSLLFESMVSSSNDQNIKQAHLKRVYRNMFISKSHFYVGKIGFDREFKKR